MVSENMDEMGIFVNFGYRRSKGASFFMIVVGITRIMSQTIAVVTDKKPCNVCVLFQLEDLAPLVGCAFI